MDSIQWLLVALLIIAIWTAVVFVLWRKGLLARANMSLFGPIVMWRTVKGRQFLDWLSRPKRFWRLYGNFSIAFCLVAMVLLTGFLLWEATIVPSIPRASAPSPDLLIGIPGVNRVIPVTYGILGLAVAIIVHEFLHGILARTAKVPLKSLGILLLIFPIGAFVEPDDEELRKMPRRQRARLFAVGPATNALVALLFAFLFSTAMMASVRPAHSGVGIAAFSMTDSPAERAGLVPGMIVFRANGTDVNSLADFIAVMEKTHAGQDIVLEAYHQGAITSHTVTLIEGENKRVIMGVQLMTITTAYFHPIGGADYFGGVERSALTYITLPFIGLQPISPPVTDFYVIEGFWGSVPAPAFWILANSLYWIFWISLMLGATNVLPAVPMDGGYVFRDGFDFVLERLKKDMPAEKREKVIRGTSYALALLILALILWQFIGPWVFSS